MEEKIDFENLEVWQRSVLFADQILELTEQLNSNRKHFRITSQLESSVTSISLNIAEGKGRYSKKEFIRFLYSARGSAYETVTILEIFKRRSWINIKIFQSLKKEAIEICKMINGLITSIKNSVPLSR